MTDWKAKYEEEHRLRCEIERRFDYRFSDEAGVFDKGQEMSQVREADGPVRRELRETIGDLLGLVNVLNAMFIEVDVVELMWLKVLVVRWWTAEINEEPDDDLQEQLADQALKVFSIDEASVRKILDSE